jgi:hypothetical protein
VLKEKVKEKPKPAGEGVAGARVARGKRRSRADEALSQQKLLHADSLDEAATRVHVGVMKRAELMVDTDASGVRAASAAIADEAARTSGDTPWPAEVDLILSAMDAGRDPYAHDERRDVQRIPYRVRATLRLFSDTPGTGPWTIYTRDVDPRGLGFLSPHRLPLGYGGWVELPSPGGRVMKIHCTLFRCRETVKGWFDCALYFNREQHLFERGA